MGERLYRLGCRDVCVFVCFFFFFRQKTAYELCGRDWGSDVCSSDLPYCARGARAVRVRGAVGRTDAGAARAEDRKSVV